MKITLDSTLLLMLIFLFIIIAVEVGTLKIDYTVIYPNHHPEVEAPPGSQVAYGNYSWVFISLFYGIIVAGIIGAILMRRKLKDRILEDVISNLIALVIIVGIFMGVIFLSNKVSINTGGGNAKPVGGFPVSLVIFYAAFIFMIGVLFYAILRNIKVEKKEIVERKDAKKYVEQAIYSVKLGEDVRSSILKAYLELERMIRDIRASEKRHYTPREFERFIIENFKVSREPVEKLVGLFEAARYSTHVMTEGQRNEAIKALEVIKNEIS